MGKVKKSVLKFIQRIKAIKSVFKYNDGRCNLLLNLQGYSSNRVYMYPDFKKNKKYYYKDFHRYYSYIVNDKNQYIFTQLMSFFVFSNLTNYGKVLGVISKGEFIPYQNTNTNYDELFNLDKFVVKHILGGKGKYVYIINKIGNKYNVNSEIMDSIGLVKLLSKLNNYIVQEFVEQHDYIKSIYDKSTNTIRVVTMREPNSNNIFIGWAAQRIGTNNSAPFDNWSAGGISSEINIETGILSCAKYYNSTFKRTETYEKHPETNAQIKGVKVPHWKQIINSLTYSHKCLPQINFIAWDVVVTKESFTIIEVNNTSGVEHIQVHRPLLLDESIKKFFKFHGIVKKSL